MTKEAKKLWLGIGGVVILIILLLYRSRGSSIINQTTNNLGTTQLGSVDIPAFNLPPRSPINISLPQIPGMPPFDFSMISGCACGNSSTAFYNPNQDLNYNYQFTNYDIANYNLASTQEPCDGFAVRNANGDCVIPFMA